MQAEQPQVEVLTTNLGYLRKRREQMDYPHYLALGLPIGSGAVESSHKVVVEARLKGAGMHWAGEHVNPMVALRNVACNARWEEAWPQIVAHLRQQGRSRAAERRAERVAPAAPPPAMPIAVAPATPPQPAEAPPALARPKGPQRPAPNHPWRHMPIGRAKYRPTSFSKN